MKKFLGLFMITMCGVSAFAQEAEEPIVIPDATARKISQDGKWVGCHGTSIVVYNVETKTSEVYPECSIGNGNAIALDGTTVGVVKDLGVFMKDGKIIEPDIFLEAEFCGLNGITADGSRVTGYTKNPVLIGDDTTDPYEEGIPVYLPFYSDIAADGTIEKINILPIPEKDFLGEAPMRVTAEWISNDGKTIMGTLVDFYGRFEDPIIFNESENGEWTYSTPTKEFFNPKGIVLPENPWTKAPAEPSLKNYMTTLQYQAYVEALNEQLFNGGPEVDPLSYMTPEMAEKYIADYQEYENYFINHKAEFDAYEKAYRELLLTSIYFGEAAMDPEGVYFASTGSYYEEEEGTSTTSEVVIFNIQTGKNQIIESRYPGLKVHQVLSDGTVLAYTGLFTYDILQGYIYLPGAEDFIPFSTYLTDVNPDYAEWLEEFFGKGEGILSASEDLSVIAGGVDLLSATDESLFPDSIILSYVLPEVKGGAGVETIEDSPKDGLYRVYNLMGVKLLETKDKSEINNLGKGIYIVNGKKIIL